jgi:hypothetical protein
VAVAVVLVDRVTALLELAATVVAVRVVTIQLLQTDQ